MSVERHYVSDTRARVHARASRAKRAHNASLERRRRLEDTVQCYFEDASRDGTRVKWGSAIVDAREYVFSVF